MLRNSRTSSSKVGPTAFSFSNSFLEIGNLNLDLGERCSLRILPIGVLDYRKPLVFAFDLDARNFGWRFAIQCFVRSYVVMVDLVACEYWCIGAFEGSHDFFPLV